MTTNQTIDGVPRLRELLGKLDSLNVDEFQGWAFEVGDELRALLDAPANKCGNCGAETVQACNDRGCFFFESGNGEPAAQAQGGVTHWANPDHVDTITAELKAHNLSLGGAPAAAVARYTIALGPVIQPQGEPVAWYTDDHLTDKSATTYDGAVMERWKAKGWLVKPLYAEQPAPVAAAQIGGFNVVEDPSIPPGQIRMCNCNQGRLPCRCRPIPAGSESLAQQIYQSWESQPGFVPWVDGGNSTKQDEARQIASRMFELAMANQVD